MPLDAAAAIWLWGGIALAIIAMRALLRAAVPGMAFAHALIGGTLFVTVEDAASSGPHPGEVTRTF